MDSPDHREPSLDTGDVLARAAAEGRDDPDPPGEVTNPDDPSWVAPYEHATPVPDDDDQEG